jgi:exodeoxyribonuclease VIII
MSTDLALIPEAVDYHADFTAVSHSMLEVFRASVPRFHQTFVTGQLPRPEPTPQMIFGSRFHKLLLEPERANFKVPPTCDRRTKAGKELYELWSQENQGCEVLDQDDLDKLRRMVDAVRANTVVKYLELLDRPGQVERAVRWECPETGLACKCRPDKLFPRGVVLDVKTTVDPDPEAFGKACHNFGYGRQVAYYVDGLKTAAGILCDFYFLVVSKEQPHEVMVCDLHPDDVDQGRRENRALLGELELRMDSGDWSGRYSGEVQTVRLPVWARERVRSRFTPTEF